MVEIIISNLTNSENISISWFSIIRLFDRYNIDFWIWRRYCGIENDNFDKVNYIDTEKALAVMK